MAPYTYILVSCEPRFHFTVFLFFLQDRMQGFSVLSVRFKVGVSLLLAPAGADKRSPKAPFTLVGYAGIQPAICKRIPAGAPAGARSYWKHWILHKSTTNFTFHQLNRSRIKLLCDKDCTCLNGRHWMSEYVAQDQNPKICDSEFNVQCLWGCNLFL